MRRSGGPSRRNLLVVFLLGVVSFVERPRPTTALTSAHRENAFIGYSEKKQIRLCVDSIQMCSDWAKNGECAKNPGYMSENCCCACNTKCPASTDDAAKEEMMAGERYVLVLKDVRFGANDERRRNRAIRIRLLEKRSPKIVGAFKEFGRNSVSGAFYRSEAVPEVGAIDNYGGPGPPYALIQASQTGRMSVGRMPREFAPLVERGFACLIGEGPDWFIAIDKHHEWGHGHSVWGIVEDDESLEVADEITRLPIRNERWGQTNVTVLVEKVSFQFGIEEVD